MKLNEYEHVIAEHSNRLMEIQKGRHKFLAVVLNPDLVKQAFVEFVALYRSHGNGHYEFIIPDLMTDPGCLGLPKEERLSLGEGFLPAEEDEEDEKDEGGESDEDNSKLRPYASIGLPPDCQSKYLPGIPMRLVVSKTYHGVKVNCGDGADDLDILYINNGDRPLTVEGESLKAGESLLVRGKAHIVGVGITKAERKRLDRIKEDKLIDDTLGNPILRISAYQKAVTRYFTHAGRQDAKQKGTDYVNQGYREIEDIMSSVTARTEGSPHLLRMSQGERVRCRMSLAAGLYGARVTRDETPERDGAEIARILAEYLADEKNGDILPWLVDECNLLALI